MEISCFTCQKEEKEFMCVIYFINAVLWKFPICCNLRFFTAKSFPILYQGKVLTPEIDLGNFLTPRKDYKIDRNNFLGTDLRFLETSR